MSSYSAVLLAGGKSRRMGRDKAFIEVDGQPLWQRQLQLLQQLEPQEIFIAGPAREEWRHISVLTDAQEDAGPLAGLTSALRRCQSPFLLVLAVDLPKMTAEYLRDLCSEGVGVVPKNQDRFEPLAAIYPTTALGTAEAQLATGNYAMQKFAAQCIDQGLVRPREILPNEQFLFTNLNRPSDLRAIRTDVTRYEISHGFAEQPDDVAAEAPLEIRIEGRSVALFMRTPGHDSELAAGFCVTENLVRSPDDIFEITQCGSSPSDYVVNVTLRNPASFDPAKLTRNVFSSSSCGVCSKATIEAVQQSFPPIANDGAISAGTLLELPARLREKQETFQRTGGLHACALFDLQGELQSLREDVGRHNALDKLIGRALLDGRLPLRDRVLFLSGRVSFEMMQKALAAGIPIVAAISAPTSLAVEFARESNQTLVGFVRGETMNIYAATQRITPDRRNVCGAP